LHFSTKRPAPFEFSGTVLETRSINALGKANRQWTDTAGDTSNSGYDKGGNRISATDGKSETTTYVFDARGRQIKQVDRLAGETEFAYTDTGQLASLTDAENQVTSYTYDDAGRKASEAFTMGGQTYTTGLDYDAAGQLIEYTYPDGSVVARSYNDRGQLYQISFDSTVIDTRAYDDGGRMTSSTYNNGVGETRAYNVDNTLASITFSGASIGTYSYGWDDNKNKTSETITGAMSGYGFAVGSSGYDEEDRLLNWERTDSNLDQSWDLSLVGDWDSFTENSSTQNRTHGPTHELLTAGGQSLTHDTKGNMTLIPSGLRSNASSLALTWDFENKMKTADIGNNSSVDVTYKWDALGRRVYRDDGTSAFVYVQVGQQTIADYGWSVAPASPKYNYVYASYIDEPVMREEPSANERLFFHRSQQFSTVALTTSSATIAERYAYSAYGAPTVCSVSGTDIGASTKDNRITYTGREWDDELVLYHFRARLYDADVGRFLGRDPIGYDGSEWNLFEYVDSRTLVGKDPSGTSVWVDNGSQVAGIHQRICVSTYDDSCNKTGKFCISFGVVDENEGASSGEGGGSDSDDPATLPNLPGVIDDDAGDGIIYVDTEPASGPPVEGFGTCCRAEKAMEAYMRSIVGRRGNYCFPYSTCRSFSKQLLFELRSKYRNGDFGECPCPPWWQRVLGGMGPLGPPHVPLF
jgi:RHS repeat-associated protein